MHVLNLDTHIVQWLRFENNFMGSYLSLINNPAKKSHDFRIKRADCHSFRYVT
jgi:hypothetical protein